MPPDMPIGPCCSPPHTFDLLPILVVGGAFLLAYWLRRRSTPENRTKGTAMKPAQKIVIALVVLAAAAVVIAKRGPIPDPIPRPDAAPAAAQAPLPRLVDLGAGKCIPCKAMAPILEELRRDYASTFEVVFIDVWENPDAAKPYDINLIPTQIFYDSAGKELWRHEGFLAKDEILAQWRSYGVLN